MKRRDAREIAFELTYEMVMNGEFNEDTETALLSEAKADKDSRQYIKEMTRGIQAHRDELKELIAKYARDYAPDRIYKTDLAVLYLACYELKYTDTPRAVIVNEAVEIAKAYSDVQSHVFVNGILASVITELGADNT